MLQAAGAGQQGQAAPAGLAVPAKPKRPKKSVIIALVAVAAIIVVMVGVRLAIPSGDPVSTMYFGLDGYSAESLGYSINGEDVSLALAGQSLTGKVQDTRQSGDVTIYEVGQISFSGTEMPGDSKALVRVPKEATTGNPAGQWGITLLGDYSPRQIIQMKISVDGNGACSYTLAAGTRLSSDDFDAFAADPLKDPSCLDGDDSEVVTASGTLSKTDTEGQFSVEMSAQLDDDTEELTGTLNLSAQYFDDLTEQYGD